MSDNVTRMEPEQSPNRRGLWKKIVVFAVVVAAVCGLVALILFSDGLNLDSLRRWVKYMNVSGDGSYGVYSFDRIQEISLTDVKFEVRDDFDAQDYFSECFGVVAGDGTPAERIILRVYGKQRYYLHDLPLHHSQKAIGQGENYTDFEYYVRPTYDSVDISLV